MNTLVHLRDRGLAVQEAIGLVVALAIAETFYKFHSFILEAVAFLVTWYILGVIIGAIWRPSD